ncbi:MAG TPA: O-methyltransferase [Acidimicrobiales bacterium]|nr:O-methyltransferase [Acidimicrobiales bacterium]
MADPQTWDAVDSYIVERQVGSDPVLAEALEASRRAGLPPISVSATQGKFLHLLAAAVGARRVLEIGTLGGYSTIWLGRALPPGGRLVTLEISPAHAAVARSNLERAGLSEAVEVRLGPALESLPGLVDEEPFDLVFIDADKPSNADYFEWAVRLAHKGTVIVVDNVVRNGAVLNDDGDPNVIGVRRLHDLLASERRVSATTVQTVGAKGYDGFTMALVLGGEAK